MIPEVILTTGETKERIRLSAGTVSRLLVLIREYGSGTAVIEAGIELLAKTETNPTLSAGARQRLRILSDQLEGSETAVIEMGLEYLTKLIYQGYIATKEQPENE